MMIVGPAGGGKSCCSNVLSKAITKIASPNSKFAPVKMH